MHFLLQRSFAEVFAVEFDEVGDFKEARVDPRSHPLLETLKAIEIKAAGLLIIEMVRAEGDPIVGFEIVVGRGDDDLIAIVAAHHELIENGSLPIAVATFAQFIDQEDFDVDHFAEQSRIVFVIGVAGLQLEQKLEKIDEADTDATAREILGDRGEQIGFADADRSTDEQTAGLLRIEFAHPRRDALNDFAAIARKVAEGIEPSGAVASRERSVIDQGHDARRCGRATSLGNAIDDATILSKATRTFLNAVTQLGVGQRPAGLQAIADAFTTRCLAIEGAA